MEHEGAELEELDAAVRALPRGWRGMFFREVGSTQDVARAAVAEGVPHRSVFVADYQTAGRGRQGRRWLAGRGAGLLVSIVLREPSQTEPWEPSQGPRPRPWRATSLASVALAEAVERLAPTLRPRIKWPNDLMLGHRKLAGILAEGLSQGDQQTIIVGVGINVSTGPATLEALPDAATCLDTAAGHPVRRAALLHAFLERFDDWLDQPAPMLYANWEGRLWGRNQHIRLADGQVHMDAVILGADEDGALRIRLADGSVQHTFTAEVLW